MLALGSPGSGKSKFLEHLIRSDLEARRGLCLIDIHGSLYQDVKRWCAYRFYLTRGVILLDPSSGAHVKGFNPFRARRDVAVDVQVSGMVQALLRVWGAENSNDTPTLDRVLRLLFTAMVVRGIPLHEAFSLISFTEHEFREDVISSFTEPVIRAAWGQLQSLRKIGEWRAEVLSTENRLFRLVSSPTICRFMGSSDDDFNLDCAQVMERQGALLVNLKESPTLSEDNAKAFAALLVNDLFKSAIMFRDADAHRRPVSPFYLYLDEWQTIVTPDIKKILAQARKFGLILVLANQDLAQLREAFTPEFVETLMTCCQAKACFGGLNRDDALRMAREMMGHQIDFAEAKDEITATKFRPRYGRDKVYGDTQIAGIGDAAAYAPFDQMIGFPALRTSATKTKAKGQQVSDVPIFIPEEFTETTSRAYYTLEEQLWRWADRFIELPQRECFLKLPRARAVRLTVPLVNSQILSEAKITFYETQVAKYEGARSVEEVDRMLSEETSEPEFFAAAVPDDNDTPPLDE